ncbi:MAG: hypothetical protein DRI97_12665, partial [Bacteroidetes bacterium]
MNESPNKIKQILNNPILQTLVIFVSGGWIVLEITDYLIENFGLNEHARKILLIVLLALLPVALFLAWYVSRQTGTREIRKSTFSFKRRRIVIPAVLIVTAAVISLGLRYQHQSRMEQALRVTLPSIKENMKQITESDGIQNWKVFQEAQKLKRMLRDQAEFHQLWNEITVKVSISTDPREVAIYARSYGGQDTAWYFLGNSPLEDVAIPRGLSQIKLENPGFVNQYDIIYSSFGYLDEFEPRHYQLHKSEEVPDGMVFASGFTGDWFKTGSLPKRTAGDFW